MAEVEYTQLLDVLARVSDPRKRRGQRYAWSVILTLLAAALVSGERHGRGIGQWVRERREALCQRLGLVRLPSEATLRRALQQIDPIQLTAAIAQLAAALPDEAQTSPADWRSMARSFVGLVIMASPVSWSDWCATMGGSWIRRPHRANCGKRRPSEPS